MSIVQGARIGGARQIIALDRFDGKLEMARRVGATHVVNTANDDPVAAVRCGIPVLTVVLNNSSMAIEIPHLVVSHDKYGTRDIGGRYADLGRAMGGWSERVERPEDIAGAFARARKATEGGQAALLEFITSQETRFSHRGALR